MIDLVKEFVYYMCMHMCVHMYPQQIDTYLQKLDIEQQRFVNVAVILKHEIKRAFSRKGSGFGPNVFEGLGSIFHEWITRRPCKHPTSCGDFRHSGSIDEA